MKGHIENVHKKSLKTEFIKDTPSSEGSQNDSLPPALISQQPPPLVPPNAGLVSSPYSAPAALANYSTVAFPTSWALSHMAQATQVCAARKKIK